MDIFLTKWDMLLYSLSKLSKHVYILGDFNINLLKYHDHQATDSFIESIFSHMYIPLINRPTRITNISATAIDNIITNCIADDYYCISGIFPHDASDHFAIFHISTCHRKPTLADQLCVSKRVINKTTVDKFAHALSCTDWQCIIDCSDTQLSYTNFHKIYIYGCL